MQIYRTRAILINEIELEGNFKWIALRDYGIEHLIGDVDLEE